MKNIFFYDVPGSCVAHSCAAPVFAVKAFERGYYPIQTARSAAELNGGKWTPAQLDAALCGSMAGWDVPGARDAVEAVEAVQHLEEAAARKGAA
jgi:hypothetical protein